MCRLSTCSLLKPQRCPHALLPGFLASDLLPTYTPPTHPNAPRIACPIWNNRFLSHGATAWEMKAVAAGKTLETLVLIIVSANAIRFSVPAAVETAAVMPITRVPTPPARFGRLDLIISLTALRVNETTSNNEGQKIVHVQIAS